ncbi:hypothetical protein HOG17_04195 [Candidatus Peregrinibacteria bacterium]|jgi:hypothetical protein|nr:hypothetical protein [Candidatus Peregrinibacteria bacterium]MBT4147988.1 hypothetical protein [Candidatus Peregrinibacteria bacterium]MBT4366105.1 hypothetical protein [Candidatus Peregrinibacteria bacterium]MBT4456237.1 hypothetical protein [Candidatus Peregrinibacteria bacterium]
MSDERDSGQKLKKALGNATDLDEKEQQKLNEPLSDPTGVDTDNDKFLDDILGKIEGGQIDLHTPSSLINQDVYKRLSESVQGETDLNTVSLLARLRELKGLHDLGQVESYQFKNLIEQVRLTKERLEKDAGDIFII